MLALDLLRYESIGWAEELLDAAAAADVSQLPRLYTCRQSLRLHRAPRDRRRLRPESGGVGDRPALRRLPTRVEHHVAGPSPTSTPVGSNVASRSGADMAAEPRPGFRRVVRHGANAVATAGGGACRGSHEGSPTKTSPPPAPMATRLGSRSRSPGTGGPSPIPIPTGRWPPTAKGLNTPESTESSCKRPSSPEMPPDSKPATATASDALELFDTAIDTYHRVGNHPGLAITLANLAVFFDRTEQSDIAATIYGSSTRYQSIVAVAGTSRSRGTPPRRARRHPLRPLCRDRGGARFRGRRRLRPPPDPTRPPTERPAGLTTNRAS